MSEKSSMELGEKIERPRESVDFHFAFQQRQKDHVIRVEISLPLECSIQDLVHRLIASHNIPWYLSNELYHSLDKFVHLKQMEFMGKVYSHIRESTKVNKEKLKSQCTQFQSTAHVMKSKKVEDFDTTWSDVYHQLIHSHALGSLLQIERTCNSEMKQLVSKRNEDLEQLTARHVLEMDAAIEQGGYNSDHEINQLATKQSDDAQMQEIYWSSAITELREKQKREYKDWVMKAHQDTTDYTNIGILPSEVKDFDDTEQPKPAETYMEESYTIHLGNQMKSMHNIRLVCRNILDYCYTQNVSQISVVNQPHRLQTAMALYSENLSAMILMVNNGFDVLTGLQKEFNDVMKESTDFHFPYYEQQLCLIEQALSKHRNPDESSQLLQTGDFYLTRHSNLAEVHTIFHLISDESLSITPINSRHPILNGVRNIILAAARNNITNLIIPLFLVHEMGENFTVQWCLKRAELVFKCVKGFMMESLSWDGDDSRTLQFVVPPGISDDLFFKLNNMLPSIFRVSTTLNLSNLAVK